MCLSKKTMAQTTSHCMVPKTDLRIALGVVSSSDLCIVSCVSTNQCSTYLGPWPSLAPKATLQEHHTCTIREVVRPAEPQSITYSHQSAERRGPRKKSCCSSLSTQILNPESRPKTKTRKAYISRIEPWCRTHPDILRIPLHSC